MSADGSEPFQRGPGHPWGEWRKNELRRMWPTGATFDEIADALHTSRCSVRRWVNKLDLPRRARASKGGKWTDQDIEKMRDMLTVERLSAGQVAARMGITRNAVIGKAWRNDIPMMGGNTSIANGIVIRKVKSASATIAGMTPAELDEFKRLYATGLSMANMGKQLGIPKSSVHWVSKALGLPARDRAQSAARWHSDKNTYRGGIHSKKLRGVPKIKSEPIVSVAWDGPPIMLLDLRPGDCRYTVGEATGVSQMFCGAPTPIGESWCRDHHRVVYRPDQRITNRRLPTAAG